MKVLGFTEARANFAKTLDAVVDDGEETVIHRNNDRSVVIISLAEWNAMKETQHLLNGANGEILRRRIADMDAPGRQVVVKTTEELEALTTEPERSGTEVA
ncbi:type II toxin-antitoxin system Phd/YefM family antitoxin [Actinoplanes sp. NPDC049265]|uniref:type II toxin-antitoxin system Phd/YefM family antitoxin n=1 Tax=Actinoplanes sp. NPDC049265 TaxID=3363902 RepID=UPI0037152F4C